VEGALLRPDVYSLVCRVLADARQTMVLQVLLQDADVDVGDMAWFMGFVAVAPWQRFHEHSRAVHFIVGEALRQGGITAKGCQRICQDRQWLAVAVEQTVRLP
jgi:hypothetical protein